MERPVPELVIPRMRLFPGRRNPPPEWSPARQGGVFPLVSVMVLSGTVLCFFLLPLLAALGAGLGAAPSGRPGIPPALVPVTLFTLKQAFLSTLLALALGLPGAWFGTRRRWLRALTGVPFVLPPVLVVLAFVLFFGRSGWANRFLALFSGGKEPLRILYRPLAVILAHGFYNFPIVVRLAGDGIEKARDNWGAASGSLGASPLVAAVTVVLPLAAPSILASALLVFLYCFTSFSLVLVLGGGPAVTTLAVEIYRYARVSLDMRAAGLLAAVETFFSLGAFLLYAAAGRGLRGNRETASPPERRYPRRPSLSGGIARGVYGAALAALVALPLLTIPAQSLLVPASRSLPPRLSPENWLGIGDRALPALGRSLLLAAVSASLASLLAVLGAAGVRLSGGRLRGNLTRLAAAAPLASSGIVLGLGYHLLYGGGVSFLHVAAFHAVMGLPFAFNSILRGYEDVPLDLSRAATVAGAGPFLRTATVEIPLALRRLRSAWAFAAAISLGELSGVLMMGPGDFETLPLLVYRAAGAYRYGTACAAGTLLMAACAGAFLLVETGGDHAA